jgi:hypothetical protein
VRLFSSAIRTPTARPCSRFPLATSSAAAAAMSNATLTQIPLVQALKPPVDGVRTFAKDLLSR